MGTVFGAYIAQTRDIPQVQDYVDAAVRKAKELKDDVLGRSR